MQSAPSHSCPLRRVHERGSRDLLAEADDLALHCYEEPGAFHAVAVVEQKKVAGVFHGRSATIRSAARSTPTNPTTPSNRRYKPETPRAKAGCRHSAILANSGRSTMSGG
jgi:hypothetical protein